MGWDAFPWEHSFTVEGWNFTPNAPDFTLYQVANPGSDFDQEGAFVCQAGYKTAGVNNCGQIISTANSCGDHSSMRTVGYARDGGDSGATVYGFRLYQLDVPLVGFHSGYCNNYPRYTFVRNAQYALGIDGWYIY